MNTLTIFNKDILKTFNDPSFSYSTLLNDPSFSYSTLLNELLQMIIILKVDIAFVVNYLTKYIHKLKLN